ncbi:hypothetical protein GGI05_001269, partial [Coemansia sp. RSA 2603]
WSHVRMLSFEIDGVREGEVSRMLVQFAKKHLGHVDELWLGVDGRLRFFDTTGDSINNTNKSAFSNVRELRVIGRDAGTIHAAAKDVLPVMPQLTTVHLDAAGSLLTTAGDLVRTQHLTVQALSIDMYDAQLAYVLQLSDNSPWLTYPALHKLTLGIAQPTSDGLLDARRVPELTLLSSAHAEYPVTPQGTHTLRDQPDAQLLRQRFRSLRVLATDALTLGDVQALGRTAGHSLESLSVGGLFADVELLQEPAALRPAVCLTAPAMAHIMRTCPGLHDLRLLVPPAYEDLYNGVPPDPTHTAAVERPAMHPVDWPEHQGLRHVCVHAWAMTFAQALSLTSNLPQLTSLDWVLRMTHVSDGQLTTCLPATTVHRLAHVSVAHTVPVRLKHAFKAALLRFAGALRGPLRVLDVYGALVVPGLTGAVGRVAPGCVAEMYPLVPSWADTSDDAEESEEEEEAEDD